MIICILILIYVSVQKDLPTKNKNSQLKQDAKQNQYDQTTNVHLQYMSYVSATFVFHAADRWIQPMETAVISLPRKSEMQLCNSCSFIQIHWHLSSLERDNWSKNGDATMCLQEYIPFIKESFCLNLRKYSILTGTSVEQLLWNGDWLLEFYLLEFWIDDFIQQVKMHPDRSRPKKSLADPLSPSSQDLRKSTGQGFCTHAVKRSQFYSFNTCNIFWHLTNKSEQLPATKLLLLQQQ